MCHGKGHLLIPWDSESSGAKGREGGEREERGSRVEAALNGDPHLCLLCDPIRLQSFLFSFLVTRVTLSSKQETKPGMASQDAEGQEEFNLDARDSAA